MAVSKSLRRTSTTMRLLDLELVIMVVNDFNAKETTKLPKVSTAKRLEINNNKIVGIDGSGGKPPYCWI